MTRYLKKHSKVFQKITVITFIFTLICVVSCKKESTQIDEQFVRVYNLSSTLFDTIIIEPGYNYSGYINADTLLNLAPQEKSNFIKFENASEVLQFYLTTIDSATNHYYEVWKYPSTLVDPMAHADETFPKGYYTYIITESDSIEQKYIISLWAYSINNPND